MHDRELRIGADVEPERRSGADEPAHDRDAARARSRAFAAADAGIPAVQRNASPSAGAADGAGVQEAAGRGISTPAVSLPHADRIQASFGSHHDVSGIVAHVGGGSAGACQDMGASAFAAGNHVAFAGDPDLHTAAHEAAHVLQQLRGVSLYGGVGEAGDAYERQADEVADRRTPRPTSRWSTPRSPR